MEQTGRCQRGRGGRNWMEKGEGISQRTIVYA